MLQLQQSATLTRMAAKTPSHETALPFAVTSALLVGGTGRMWAAAAEVGGAHNLLLAGGKSARAIASLLGVKTKMAKLGPQLGGGEKQVAYAVEWKRKAADNPLPVKELAPKGALLLVGAATAELALTLGTADAGALARMHGSHPRRASALPSCCCCC